MSTPGGYHDECGGYHDYNGGRSGQQRDTMMTARGLGGYHEYAGGMFNILGFRYNFNRFPNDLPPHLS